MSTVKQQRFPDDLHTFGARLRWLREIHQFTLAEFGAKIGVGKSYISKLESGKSKKTSEQFIYSICREFHLNRDWILAGDGKPFEWDHLNELVATGDSIPTMPLLPMDQKSADFIYSLTPAGIAIRFSPTIETLAAALGNEGSRQMFREPVRAEIKRILMEELSARMKFGSNQDSKTTLFKEPISELGKLAVRAVEYHKEIFSREKTKVEIGPATNNPGVENSGLTKVSDSANVPSVKAKLPTLLKRLNEATRERGTKTALAKFMGVPLPNISQWLSGEREPSGETTLQLLYWVEQQERQK